MDRIERAAAIVGLGAILPDAPDAPSFWNNLSAGRYSISDVPAERWRADDYYDPDPLAPDKTYSRIGGWVRGFRFDWKGFRVPPKVADAMDEGQQWAVSMAAEALRDFGYPARPLDLDRTAVVLGAAMGGERHYLTNLRVMFPEFARALAEVESFAELPEDVRHGIVARWREAVGAKLPPITEDSMPGELPNIISGRVANLLNLRGPNFITDAACASSFAALDAAIDLLVDGACDAVLTGGVDRNMGASTFVKFCKIGALSATGTRPFGDGADGFVMGEGGAVFLLKRLADAERDGDRIYAVVRGIAGSSDGRGKGITAPNPQGQVLAIRRAWESAGLDPATATMIEAHGTSTKVGDVVEVQSLAEVFAGAPQGAIALGSAKSNVGHLKAGAGAAGLLKTVYALHHKKLPPTLNATRANPAIDFGSTPFRLNTELRDWTRANGTPRRAGVSAYGFGGTNFHVVLEEHVPGLIDTARNVRRTRVSEPCRGGFSERSERNPPCSAEPTIVPVATAKVPLRGIAALGAATVEALREKLAALTARVQEGGAPPALAPDPADLAAPERLVVDYGEPAELLDRLQRAAKALAADAPAAWKALANQGIFRGRGPAAGKVAFLFPGQGSQYVNMGMDLGLHESSVADAFARADIVLEPLLGAPLTRFVFADADDAEQLARAEEGLKQTAITQPAVLSVDHAIECLLREYGFAPDYVMGHSLGEYAALVAAGVMPFEHALEASAARGREMTRVSLDDNGLMAAIMAPYDVIEKTLASIDGYVVAANINGRNQCVIGGATAAVGAAMAAFEALGIEARRLPVSHAFHTRIVAPASEPLGKVLDRLSITTPAIPIVANVTGALYPTTVPEIKDLLMQQIASPVQWVRGLETLYAEGVRTFVEVGPKKALRGLVEDVLAGREGVVALHTNHPKPGELQTFNHALCGLYAAGHGARLEAPLEVPFEVPFEAPFEAPEATVVTYAPRRESAAPVAAAPAVDVDALADALAGALAARLGANLGAGRKDDPAPFDRNATPRGSVVISGTGLGLPGTNKPVMDPANGERILRGEQFVDQIPGRFRGEMAAKRVTRLVKDADGNGRFETIDHERDVLKLAGRGGSFDLTAEYGVPDKLVEALDRTTQLALAAGLDALREAGIPLVQTWRRTTTGKYLPDRFMLPEPLRDETGVIFAAAFPGYDRFAEEIRRYQEHRARLAQRQTLEDLRSATTDHGTLREILRRLAEVDDQLQREPYEFDRRFLLRVLAMGHSQFAEYVGARGPNTSVNAACASTAQAIAIAEDWIRAGRCRRVVVVAADDVTSDNLMEWIGAGFLATGAAATDDRVEDAALPFDRRRHGTLLGMGAAALVVEAQDAVEERGMRAQVELLSSEVRNSAFHATRLDVDHVAAAVESLVAAAERRFGVDRRAMAPETVFVSHETYTPARGGSAAAEIAALRRVFGAAANEVVISNTKGFTGHPMGVGIEDVIAVKILEHGIVPPVPNLREPDPDLGPINLSRGGRYPVQYAIHLAAGFGSQVALTLTRRVPGGLDRVDAPQAYRRWLDAVTGYDATEVTVDRRVLRVVANGVPPRAAAPSTWRFGLEPVKRAPAAAATATATATATPMRDAADPAAVVGRVTAPAAPKPAPTPDPTMPVAASPAGAGSANPVGAGSASPVGAGLASPVGAGLASEASVTRPIAAPATTGHDSIVAKVLAIVAEKTGYPADMLDVTLDLEADLGVDTVKQAETFAAVREEWSIPRVENLKLRDFPTLKHVVQFVFDNRPDLATGGVGAGSASPVGAGSASPVGAGLASPVGAGLASEASVTRPVAAPTTTASDSVVARVLAIVAEKTGYPSDMLELELDLEADLGVDTVKQAETFAAVREEWSIPRLENLKLRDFPTLKHVVQFVFDNRPDLVTATDGRVTAPAAPKPAPTSEATGRAQASPAGAGSASPAGADSASPAGADSASPVGAGLASEASVTRPISPTDAITTTDGFPRRVVVPALRPALDLFAPTGVSFAAGKRVVVALDEGGVGEALARALETRGVAVLRVAPAATDLDAQLRTALAAGPIDGLFWLPALDVEPGLDALDLPAFRELNRVRVKNLYGAMRALYEAIAAPGTFLVSATRMGGCFGYGDDGATAPLGGGVSGFTKAYKRERPDALVKVVDVDDAAAPEDVAAALLDEALSDPGVVEIGRRDGLRWTPVLEEQDVPAAPAVTLGRDAVVVVTGAAGGITSAIVADLARASGGTFWLLDLAPAAAKDDPHVALFRQGRDALKDALIAEAKAAGRKVKPVDVDRQIMGVERAAAALAAIDAVEAAGGMVHYRQVNLLDAASVGAVLDEVRARHARVDAVVHAAGLEISRNLDAKEPSEFALVYDVKADGFFNVLAGLGATPIGATVVFSSVAGRFGNSGQTDYSAANALLCAISRSFRRTRPATRGIATDWTAWAQIGMATRGSIPKLMEAAGIEMLPPDVGLPVVRRELLSGRADELVVAGKLGILAREWAPRGGAAAVTESPFVVAGRVLSVAPDEFVVETTLDPAQQPFLHHHQIEGVPVLPGVMGLEAFTEAARLAAPDLDVTAIEDVRFEKPFKFHRGEPATFRVVLRGARPVDGGVALQAELRSTLQPKGGLPPQERLHFAARVTLGRARIAAPVAAINPPPESGLTIGRDAIYRVFFHGPSYRVLDAVRLENGSAFAVLSGTLPADTASGAAPLLASPRFVEACFQAVGVYEIARKDVLALPSAATAVRFHAAAPASQPGHFVIVDSNAAHDEFGARLVDADGQVLVELTGYRTSALPGRATFGDPATARPGDEVTL